MLAMMLYTGCNLYELMGLEVSDIYLDNFQSFIIIRNNSIRPIKSVYKIRTIPLVGISRVGANNFLNELKMGKIFFNRKKISQVENLIKKILSDNFNITTLKSIKLSLVSRLIKAECPELIKLQRAVCYSGFGGGYTVQDVCNEFSRELGDMQNWQLHQEYSYLSFEGLVRRTKYMMVGFDWEKHDYSLQD